VFSRRWKKVPLAPNWGDFGEDDQIGRLNLLTPGGRYCSSYRRCNPGKNFFVLVSTALSGGEQDETRTSYPPGFLKAVVCARRREL